MPPPHPLPNHYGVGMDPSDIDFSPQINASDLSSPSCSE
ncbi:unnamed protein product [Enterobius vermicularis]|uniref:Sox C-terminal domain-containing protein n=1 Tax=Enterobius vermicularis TaxID=51028 RepID=A0A0N4VQU6_ENTVE|nr:unnamed protein product [Enterobius vermicularis]